MSNVIQCPQCAKRFRLPERVPPTFACTQCGTVMDLGAFQAAAPAAAPAPPARPAGAGGGRTTRRAAGPARSRRGGRADPRLEDEAGGRRGAGRSRPQGNPALMIGSVAALLGALLLIVVTSGDKESKAPEDPAGGPPSASAGGAPPDLRPDETPEPGAGAPAAAAPGAPAGTTPAAEPDKPPAPSKEPARLPRIVLSGVQLKVFPWPDEVDAATRQKVEELLPAYLRGDRWSRDAQAELLALGRPIAGRLISEWKHIEEQLGLDSREGKSRVMAIESLLRAMDGWIERYWKQEANLRIRHTSDAAFVDGQIKRWVAWWEGGYWKAKPLEPWDEKEDGSDLTEEERARLKEEERKRAEEEAAGGSGGYGRRAGE